MSGAAPETTRQKAKGAVPFAALSGILRIIVGLVGLLLLVRYLTPERYGVWALVTGLAMPMALYSSLGFRHSVLRFMPACADDAERGDIMWTVLLRRSVVLVAMSLSGILTFSLFAERFGIAGDWEAFLYVQPGLVTFAMDLYLVAGLNVAFKQREVFYSALAQQVAHVGFVIVGIQMGADIDFFALVYSGAAFAKFALNFVFAVRVYGAPRLRHLLTRWEENEQQKRYRRASYVDDVGTSFLTPDISRYFVALVSTSVEVAIYSVAANVVTRLRDFLPVDLFRPLATVSFFGRYEESGDIEDVNRMFHFLFALNHLVGILYLALFLPLGQQALVWVFREEYAGAYVPALCLFAGIGLFSMPIGIVAQTLHRPGVLVYAKLAVIVNVGLGVPLAIEYGAAGMAFATMLSAIVRNLIAFVLLRREFAITLPWRSMLRFLLAGALTAGALWGLKPYVSLMALAVLGVVSWAVSTRLLGVLSPWERRLLLSLFPSRAVGILRVWVGT